MPILHLHLLQRCNLRCAHCYSESAPDADAALALDEALGAVALGHRLGYTHVAISGGEPLLSPHLSAVVDRAKALGQHVSVVTNGLQANQATHTRRLVGVDSVCVSLDGARDTHDAMRRRAGAYDSALRAIAALRDAGVPCGVSCGVSGRSLYELEEVLAAAAAAGAGFLNFHAIEAAGRGLALGPGQVLERSDLAVLFVAVHLLAQQSLTAGCVVHCDLVHKDRAAACPTLLYADTVPANANANASVATRLGVLVVEPTGALSPVSHGFRRGLSLGHLRQALDSGGDSVEAALPSVIGALQDAGSALLRELQADDDWVVLNPSAELARVAALRGPAADRQGAERVHRLPLPVPRQVALTRAAP